MSNLSHLGLKEHTDITSGSVVGDSHASILLAGGSWDVTRSANVPSDTTIILHSSDGSSVVNSNQILVAIVTVMVVTADVEMLVVWYLGPGTDVEHLSKVSHPLQLCISLLELHHGSSSLVTATHVNRLVILGVSMQELRIFTPV